MDAVVDKLDVRIQTQHDVVLGENELSLRAVALIVKIQDEFAKERGIFDDQRRNLLCRKVKDALDFRMTQNHKKIILSVLSTTSLVPEPAMKTIPAYCFSVIVSI